jgi:hypothetical protein
MADGATGLSDLQIGNGISRPLRHWRDCLRGKSWGWTVQFTYGGRRVRRFFSDSRYGSTEAAQSAAQAFAYADLSEQAEYLALTRRLRLRSNCRSGIPGVARYERPNGSAYWTAFWDDETGRKKQRKFFVGRLGEAEAARRAVACRLEAQMDWQSRLAQIQAHLG